MAEFRLPGKVGVRVVPADPVVAVDPVVPVEPVEPVVPVVPVEPLLFIVESRLMRFAFEICAL